MLGPVKRGRMVASWEEFAASRASNGRMRDWALKEALIIHLTHARIGIAIRFEE